MPFYFHKLTNKRYNIIIYVLFKILTFVKYICYFSDIWRHGKSVSGLQFGQFVGDNLCCLQIITDVETQNMQQCRHGIETTTTSSISPSPFVSFWQTPILATKQEIICYLFRC